MKIADQISDLIGKTPLVGLNKLTKNIVAIICDTGERYLSNILYNQ